MNARVTVSGEVKLPDDVMEALDLAPGSEVAFERGASGEIVLSKAPPEKPAVDDYRTRLSRAAEKARADLRPEFVGMSTDEFMSFIRGE